ncbi:hypothetical protein QJS66_14940 [Kocuria rhizophila]|nr:hypothetical protein QJS66_14940 [Kocuria rhizophila]
MQPEREITVIGSPGTTSGPLSPDDDVRARPGRTPSPRPSTPVTPAGPAVDHARENALGLVRRGRGGGPRDAAGRRRRPRVLYFALAPAVAEEACAALAELDSLRGGPVPGSEEKPVGTDLTPRGR